MLTPHVYRYICVLSLSLIISGCDSGQHSTGQPEHLSSASSANPSVLPAKQTSSLSLGDLEKCKSYSGLPARWLDVPTAGMVLIPSGSFELGSEQGYPDELNFGQKQRQVQAFWMDQTEVTVAQFQHFVSATGYVTDAEKHKQAAVFSPDPQSPQQWWVLRSGYTWLHPNGPKGPRAAANEPARYLTQNDAQHYAVWRGHDLPTELEWEYAAKAGQRQDPSLSQAPLDSQHDPSANYWQGQFPFENLKQDQFEGVAPVGCFASNAQGLYDMIGNVWEWTNSPYQGAHDQHMGDYQSLRQQHHPSQAVVIKGGSFLCASNYCARYRNSSRHPQEFDLATSHVGFRTIIRVK